MRPYRIGQLCFQDACVSEGEPPKPRRRVRISSPEKRFRASALLLPLFHWMFDAERGQVNRGKQQLLTEGVAQNSRKKRCSKPGSRVVIQTLERCAVLVHSLGAL